MSVTESTLDCLEAPTCPSPRRRPNRRPTTTPRRHRGAFATPGPCAGARLRRSTRDRPDRAARRRARRPGPGPRACGPRLAPPAAPPRRHGPRRAAACSRRRTHRRPHRRTHKRGKAAVPGLVTFALYGIDWGERGAYRSGGTLALDGRASPIPAAPTGREATRRFAGPRDLGDRDLRPVADPAEPDRPAAPRRRTRRCAARPRGRPHHRPRPEAGVNPWPRAPTTPNGRSRAGGASARPPVHASHRTAGRRTATDGPRDGAPHRRPRTARRTCGR